MCRPGRVQKHLSPLSRLPLATYPSTSDNYDLGRCILCYFSKNASVPFVLIQERCVRERARERERERATEQKREKEREREKKLETERERKSERERE